MSQVYTIGRVTADFDLQTSANGNSYARFTLAENIGRGEPPRTQYLQVWAWGEDAKKLCRGKVKKGSLIWVSGRLELEEFQKRDGVTTDKRLKVILDSWGYVPAGKPKGSADNSAVQTAAAPYDVSPGGEIDGDRDNLPE
jgi:single-stranded DNA-binding protein